MKILDLSAGNRAIWFNKNNPLATFLDKRESVKPTIVCDTRNIPESVGSGYDLICWDPPHMNTGPNSNMAQSYGYHTTEEILETVKLTGREAHRIAKKDALMALKWNDHDIRLERVLKLLPDWEPLFGHGLRNRGSGISTKRKVSQSYWIMLRRLE